MRNLNNDFKEFSDAAGKVLLSLGFNMIEKHAGSCTYLKGKNLFVKIIDQKYDPPEVYIGIENNFYKMIRLDFMLELFIIGNCNLTKARIDQRISTNDFFYEQHFMQQYLDKILEINPFPDAYKDWMRANTKTIKEEVEKLKK